MTHRILSSICGLGDFSIDIAFVAMQWIRFCFEIFSTMLNSKVRHTHRHTPLSLRHQSHLICDSFLSLTLLLVLISFVLSIYKIQTKKTCHNLFGMFLFAAIVLNKIDVKWFCVVKGKIALLCMRACLRVCI